VGRRCHRHLRGLALRQFWSFAQGARCRIQIARQLSPVHRLVVPPICAAAGRRPHGYAGFLILGNFRLPGQGDHHSPRLARGQCTPAGASAKGCHLSPLNTAALVQGESQVAVGAALTTIQRLTAPRRTSPHLSPWRGRGCAAAKRSPDGLRVLGSVSNPHANSQRASRCRAVHRPKHRVPITLFSITAGPGPLAGRSKTRSAMMRPSSSPDPPGAR